MGTTRILTENQLKDAKQALLLRASTLEKNGLDRLTIKRDAIWRKLDAKVRQINARIRKISEIEARNAEVIRLKEAKLLAIAEPAEEKAAAPVPKPKKKEKVAAGLPAHGGGDKKPKDAKSKDSKSKDSKKGGKK